MPTPVARPRLLAYSREVAELLGLSARACESAEFAEVFAGNRVAAGMEPYAACYGGHQFGTGRGSSATAARSRSAKSSMRRGERWELQLKGAGPTPYSRTADGRAVRALVGARVPLQRGDAPPRRADHARAEPGRDGRRGGPRHVLRRASAGRAGRGRLPRGAVVPAFRQLRDPRRAAATHELLRSSSTTRSRTHFPELGAAVPDARRERYLRGSTRSAGAPR